MNEPDLAKILDTLTAEKRKRMGLGGYNVDADLITFLVETLVQLTKHVIRLEAKISTRTKK